MVINERLLPSQAELSEKNKNNQIIVVAVAVAVVADNSLEVALQTFAQTGSMQG